MWIWHWIYVSIYYLEGDPLLESLMDWGGGAKTFNQPWFSNNHLPLARLNLVGFLAHLIWKLKWGFLINCCLSVCKLFTFKHLFLKNHRANFNQTWQKASLKGTQGFTNMDHLIIKKEMTGFLLCKSTLWFNHSSEQMCLLIWTGS